MVEFKKWVSVKINRLYACEVHRRRSLQGGCALPLGNLHPWKSASTSYDSLLVDNSAPIGYAGVCPGFACAERQSTNHEQKMYGALFSCSRNFGSQGLAAKSSLDSHAAFTRARFSQLLIKCPELS